MFGVKLLFDGAKITHCYELTKGFATNFLVALLNLISFNKTVSIWT